MKKIPWKGTSKENATPFMVRKGGITSYETQVDFSASMNGKWRPFAASSPYNTLIGGSPVYHADALDMQAYIQSVASACRFARDANPAFWVFQDDENAGFFGWKGAHSTAHYHDSVDADHDRWADQLVPAHQSMYPEIHDDGHLCIYHINEDKFYEFSRYHWLDGSYVESSTHAIWDNTGDGYSTPYGVDWQHQGCRGSGMPVIAGLLRPEKIEYCIAESGDIDHALAITIQEIRGLVDSPDHETFINPPACRADAHNYATGVQYPFYGMRLQLNPALTDGDFTSWGMSPQGKLLARCLQNYGAFVVDRGSHCVLQTQLLGPTRDLHRSEWERRCGSDWWDQPTLIPTSELYVLDCVTPTVYPP